MMIRRVAALLGILALLMAACSGGGGESAAASGGGAADCTVAVSWNNYQEERWALRDEPAIQAALEEAGASYDSADAGSSEEQQATDIDNLLADGADVLIILAQNTETILPSVEAAIDQGVPVIAYDRLIESADALYVSFDNVAVGRMQAEAVLAECRLRQLRDHQGQRRRCELRLPARRHGRSGYSRGR